MRLARLYLKNYANIFNALNRTEINIDFSRCKNKVLAIKSENGSGKSSIINELQPFFSDPNVWMPDVDVIKIIDYFLNDGTNLSITYHGYKAVNTKPKQSRCFIKRIYPDGRIVELNPNGNMTSGRDIIFSLLDVSNDYMELSQISAVSRGIGAMKPGERKRFLSSIISAITPYMKMYKLIQTKHSTLRSMIQTINGKISQLGNIELIQSTMLKNQEELDILLSQKDQLKSQISSISTKIDILKQNGHPQELFNSLLAEQYKLNESLKSIPLEVLNFSNTELIRLEKESSKLEIKIENMQSTLDEMTSKEKSLIDSIESNTIKLNSIFDPVLLEDTKSKLKDTEDSLEFYMKCFDTLGFHEYSNITETEYSTALDMIEKFNTSISSLGDKYYLEERQEAIKYLNGGFKIVDYNSMIEKFNKQCDDIKKSLFEYSDLLKQASLFDNIPKDCNHMNDCSFINYIVSAKNRLIPEEEYNKLLTKAEEINNSISEAQELMTHQNTILQCITDIKHTLEYINSVSKLILKFPNTQNISSISHIINCIVNVTPIDIDISKYREYTNYITLINLCNKDIINYKEKINSLTNANRETWLLQKSIEEDNSELSKLRVEKHTILGNFSELKKAKSNVDSALQSAYTNRDLKSQYEEFSNSLKEINEKLDPLRKNMEEIKELENSYRELVEKESSISSDYIPNLTRCIEEAKYQMVLYNQYKKDYAEYSQLYDKLEQVKYATSVNGIQAEIIDIKMNEIVSSINTLAGMMFGGRFELQKFSVTSDTFAIPFLDKETGLLRPDLSMMSNSQLSQFSMIISFVLLHNASQKYNIIRLDEIDNNLDTDNRLNFFELINTIMDILGFEQCVIISHNNELDLSACDLMITRLQNTEQYYSLINSGANVIADFMKG